MKAQTRVDEFAFILLAGIIMILILAVAYSTISNTPIGAALSTNSLQIAQGNSATVTLHLNGTGFNVTLSGSDDITNWVYFDQNNFDLTTSKDVSVTILVPRNADFRTYSGNIVVTNGNQITKVPLTVNVGLATVVNIPKNIRLGDFTVSYVVGSSVVAEKDNFEVTKGYFSESSASFTAVVPDDKFNILTDGFIQIFVESSNSAGNLLVDFNGQRIYAGTVSAGEIDIPLNVSAIHKYNSIVIRADNPGFQFWTSTDYKITFVKFGIDFNGVSSQQLSFQLDSNDVTNFAFGQLAFTVKSYNPQALGSMLVQVNGVTLFEGVPTLTYFQKTFGLEIPLYVGNNTISFSVTQSAYYQLSNVVLTIAHHI